ncbi:MAG: hypothetical protein AB8B99_20840 [Phormidesmis sp.]
MSAIAALVSTFLISFSAPACSACLSPNNLQLLSGDAETTQQLIGAHQRRLINGDSSTVTHDGG